MSFCLNVTSFPAVLKKVNKSPSKIKCSNHISCSTITYTVYIYLYKYIHKYLTCTTNFEKGGRENPKDLMRTCRGGGRRDGARKPKIAHCEGTGSFCSFLNFFLGLHTCARKHTAFWEGGWVGKGVGGNHSSVGPVGGAAIAGLAALGLLLHAVGLTALTRTTLQEKPID